MENQPSPTPKIVRDLTVEEYMGFKKKMKRLPEEEMENNKNRDMDYAFRLKHTISLADFESVEKFEKDRNTKG